MAETKISKRFTMKTALFWIFRLVTGLIVAASPFVTHNLQADWLDNWTTNQVSANYFRLDCVTYGNGRYVAFGEYLDWGMIMTSEDGKAWTLQVDGLNQGSDLSYSVALTYTGGRFFALGGFGVSAVSTNGINWAMIYQATNGIGFESYGVAYGASRYVAVGLPYYQTATNVWTSTDGLAWTPHRSGSPTNVNLRDIAFGAGTFVAIPGGGFGMSSVDDPGHIYTSPTGITWTQRNILGGSRVSFCAGVFIVPYGPGTNLLSTNGIDWTPRNTGITNQIGKVYYFNGLFMARTGQYLCSSTDGTNWIQYQKPLPGVSSWDGCHRRRAHGDCRGDAWRTNWKIQCKAYLSEPMVSVWVTNTLPPTVALSGLVGRSYRIEANADLADTNAWQTLTTWQLPNTPYLFTDSTATNVPQRFYRGVLLP
ncbi:MAG: hypothetical protein U1F83_12005 [Verrucomicrobiota bacterium]